MSIHEKALITGASAGIGATYADRLARRGFDLILVARDLARLDALAAKLRQETGIKVATVKADLTDKTDLARIEQRLQTDASITMLVNNAGSAVAGQLVQADADKLESMILLNVLAPTRLAKAAATSFAAQGRGAIINIGSVLALAPEISGAAYSGTKAYMLNLSQVMQRELAPSGVKVQAVLPGATRTEIWDRSGTGLANVPAEILMEVDELVDAALAGFDMNEAITIPSLTDVADWNAMQAARLKLGPNLSRQHPAGRYSA